MIAWFKKVTTEKVTPEEVERGAAFLSVILGVPFFNLSNQGMSATESVKRFGTPTRIFKNVRHDN